MKKKIVSLVLAISIIMANSMTVLAEEIIVGEGKQESQNEESVMLDDFGNVEESIPSEEVQAEKSDQTVDSGQDEDNTQVVISDHKENIVMSEEAEQIVVDTITVFEARSGGMSISATGIQFIKSFEGCSLKAYKALSTEEYYTIGWGHYGADVYEGMEITQEQADALFEQDIQVYVGYVNTFLNKYGITVTQNQFDALCSFTYNLGNIWASTKYPTFQLKTILINGVANYSDAEIRTAFTNWN